MSLVTLREVFAQANERSIGIGSFNFHNMESLEAIIEAAEAKRLPVICGVPARLLAEWDIETIAAMAVSRLGRSSVPAVLHLDHGKSLELVVQALKAGFTSVMYDGSQLPFEENVRNTREVVRVAHAVGVTVEGELGYVGRGDNAETLDPDRFTKVEEAVRFIDGTNADALAVAYGSVHGIYVGTPKLDFERLDQIARSVPVPLVLHGGSGLSDEDFQKSVHYGVRKINIYTDLSVAAMKEAARVAGSSPEYAAVTSSVKRIIGEVAAGYMRVFSTPYASIS